MRNAIHSAGGRVLAFDTETRELAFSGGGIERRVRLEALLRFSNSRPWKFPESVFDIVRLAAVPGDETMLVVAAENDCFLCGLAFDFDGEILRGDLLISCKKEAKDTFVALTLPVSGDGIFTCPGILYNDNPSASPGRLVPHFSAAGPASLVVEESRLPITGVNAEKEGVFLSLFSFPEPEDREWTLGLHRNGTETTFLMLASGCVSFNGVPNLIYIAKNTAGEPGEPYPCLGAGERLAKRFALSWGQTESTGHGFRDLSRSGFDLFSPVPCPARNREEVIELKMQALRERWAGDGYLCTMADNLYRAPQTFLYGWTGQSFRLALCDLRYALLKGETAGIDRMRRCVGFFLDNSGTALPGLRYNYFDVDTLRWHANGSAEDPRFSSRALGETWSDLARILLCCREHDLPEPEGARDALREGLRFFLDHRLPGGVVPLMWRSDGSPGSDEVTCAGSSVLPAFFLFWQLTGEECWRQDAEAMLDSFYERGAGNFSTPFSHATLDAACEDKEAGIPFFTASALAFKLTGEEKFRRYAEVAADWLLTWVYFHEVPFAPGSVCGTNKFRTTGWPSVSVEHHHLDVFFPAWELYEFGLLTGNRRYTVLAETVFAAWSYGISGGATEWFFHSPGRQCEQFFQTRWYFAEKDQGRWDSYHPDLRYQLRRHGYTAENLCRKHRRGGANPWDVSWIIALVLDAALSFEEQARRGK